jgi:cell division transport system permease protein
MKALLFQALYFARAAGRGLTGSPVTTGVAIVTIAVALVLVGGFLVVTTNMRALLERAGEDLALTAYLEPSVSGAGARDLADRVALAEQVASVELITKARALERWRARMGGAGLLEGLAENPLPASLEVRLRPEHRSAEGVRALAEALEGLPGIEEFGRGQQWVESYARALTLVRGLGWGLGGVLAFATLLIVANTIRLAVYARRDELEILALVGASRTFRRIPFLLEGLVQGACGAALALGLVYGLFQLAVPQLGAGLELFLGWSEPVFLSFAEMGLLIADGAALGLLGAASALFWEPLP